MATVKLQQFEGPLDLLLSLIEEQKLNITDIALAEVTEQFLSYVKELEQIEPTSLADYLNIAAKLLVIKSKAILPTLEVAEDEELEPEEDLTQKLVIYKQFKEVAKFIRQLDAKSQQGFIRTAVFSQKVNFFPDPNVTPQSLHQSILHVLQQLKELDNLPKARVKEAVSIQEKITHLQTRLASKIETSLSELLSEAKNKDEVIVTFLALLELIKQRIFSVEQELLFTDVKIKRYSPSLEQAPEPEDPEPEDYEEEDDDDDDDDDDENEDDENEPTQSSENQ